MESHVWRKIAMNCSAEQPAKVAAKAAKLLWQTKTCHK